MHGVHARTTCPSYRAQCGGRRSPRHGRRANRVCVVGGANSAGQAALHLAKFAALGHAARTGRVAGRQHVRLPHHPAEGDPEIEVRLRTRTADGHGQSRLEALTLEDVRTGQREQVPAAAVFVMIGAEPRSNRAETSSS
jgi:thioredoxin reductase (NADPH)